MSFAPIDVVFAALTLILVVRAGLRGFIEEAMGTAWVVFGALAAGLFYGTGGAFLRKKIPQIAGVPVLAEVLAAALLFLGVFIIVKLLSAILRDIVERIHLGGIDHVLGACFGVVEGIAVAAILLFLIDIQPLFDKTPVLDGSIAYQYLGSHVENVERMLKTK